MRFVIPSRLFREESFLHSLYGRKERSFTFVEDDNSEKRN